MSEALISTASGPKIGGGKRLITGRLVALVVINGFCVNDKQKATPQLCKEIFESD